MPERRAPTLADAQRQVWVRGIIGGLIIVLVVIFYLLFVVKYLYLDLPGDLFLGKPGNALKAFIDSLLGHSTVLALLWQAMPPWRPMRISPTNGYWAFLYAIWGAMAVGFIGGRLLWSARRRRAQITEFQQEMQREAWREQARAARRLAPEDRSMTMVVGQATWHQYAAPSESWWRTLWGNLTLGLIIMAIGLCVEYWFFQTYWPSGLN